jgi:GTP cyclohydrolase FolE2
MAQNDLLGEISGKLDKILKLLAVGAVKKYSKEQDKIELLDSLGFRPVEIAKFLNKSQANVNVQLTLIRNKKEPKSKSRKKKQTKTRAQQTKSEGAQKNES